MDGNVLKVGTGDGISVWTDPWIPDAENKMVSTLITPKLEKIKVCNLFREDRREWD